MTTETLALHYLRNPLRTPREIVRALDAMRQGQDSSLEGHLLTCADRISEEIPDDLPQDKADANNGRGEFDLQSLAIPAWQTMSGMGA